MPLLSPAFAQFLAERTSFLVGFLDLCQEQWLNHLHWKFLFSTAAKVPRGGGSTGLGSARLVFFHHMASFRESFSGRTDWSHKSWKSGVGKILTVVSVNEIYGGQAYTPAKLWMLSSS